MQLSMNCLAWCRSRRPEHEDAISNRPHCHIGCTWQKAWSTSWSTAIWVHISRRSAAR